MFKIYPLICEMQLNELFIGNLYKYVKLVSINWTKMLLSRVMSLLIINYFVVYCFDTQYIHH